MSKKLFDRIIVSSDDSPNFLNFWPCVSKAWQKFFDIQPTLALVTKRNENDVLLTKLKKHGEVHIVPQIDNIPIPNQAKLARFMIASKFSNEVCMIEDIDTVPLQTKFVQNLLNMREDGKILAVGHEVYELMYNGSHAGKFPISNITSEGCNFLKLFNPNNLEYLDLMKSYVGMRIVDDKENIANDPSHFSDESMIRGLIYKHNLHHMIQKVNRDVNIHQDWIDRSWWEYDANKLKAGGYVLCNFLRPCRENAQHFIPIYEYLYGYLPKPSELFVL